MEKPLASARIPQEWSDQIQQIARESGKSASEVVREAIALYLGKVDGESISTMNRRLSKLERQVGKLFQGL
jgi:predicted DNA-binding protein